MKKQKLDAQAAVAELYRKESDRLSELTREAEELLEEGNFLYRERILRKAEVARERMNVIKDVAGIFGVDVEKGR
ncbi:MAG: hypothetical protein IJQ25_05340 [Oscillibacter sp.]|nr:hypothetical protein [Oscillibacter sp.]